MEITPRVRARKVLGGLHTHGAASFDRRWLGRRDVLGARGQDDFGEPHGAGWDLWHPRALGLHPQRLGEPGWAAGQGAP